MEPISAVLILSILKVLGSITSALGVIVGVFKVIGWIKTKLVSIDENVVELKNSINTDINGLREDIKHQTATLASALNEQRQDFRTYFSPTVALMQQLQTPAPVRAKPRARKKPIKRVK